MRARHERDVDYVLDDDVVHLQHDILALGLVGLGAQLLAERIVVLVGEALGVGELPVVGLRRDLVGRPATQVVGWVGFGVVVGIHRHVGEKMRYGVGVAGVAGEEYTGVNALQLS